MRGPVNPLNITEGVEVFGSDGQKIGKVVATYPKVGTIVVERGWFFHTDYYIPFSAIKEYDHQRVYLNVTMKEALDQWGEERPYSQD